MGLKIFISGSGNVESIEALNSLFWNTKYFSRTKVAILDLIFKDLKDSIFIYIEAFGWIFILVLFKN